VSAAFAAKAVAAWAALLAVMTANGFLRVFVLAPRLGDHAARQASSVLGACLVLAFAWAFVRLLPDPASAPLGRVGLLWGVLTLAFEFGFGHYVSGVGWDALLADYDLTAGRLWPLVLAATISGPWLWGAALRHPRTEGSGKGTGAAPA
jgi:hypothetical protein